jgi:hypothetical protein
MTPSPATRASLHPPARTRRDLMLQSAAIELAATVIAAPGDQTTAPPSRLRRSPGVRLAGEGPIVILLTSTAPDEGGAVDYVLENAIQVALGETPVASAE